MSRADRDREIVDALESLLCPCDVNAATTDGPQRECPVHGMVEEAVADLKAARDFRNEVFDLAAWDRGRRWAYDTAAGRKNPLTDEVAEPMERHYAGQVRKYAEMLSRMMGRLVGYQQARAEQAELAQEGQSRWRRRASG